MILVDGRWNPPGMTWPFYAMSTFYVQCCLADKSCSFGLNHLFEISALPPLGFERHSLPKSYHPVLP